MEKLGVKKYCAFRRGKILTPKRIPWLYTFRQIASEEFNYIIDLITGGHRPGEAAKHEDTNSNR